MENNNLDKTLKSYKVGVCGVGMVGGAMQRYFEGKGVKPFLYDPGKNLGSVADLNQADVIFICVPTPFVSGAPARPPASLTEALRAGNAFGIAEAGGGFDLSYVKDAVSKIEGEKIIVIKSTVVPGTTEKLQKDYPQHKFLFNPEFLTELTADQDMNYPDRQIIGYTQESFTIAKDIIMLLPLAPFEKIMPATEAELVKYYGNNWFSVKVIYANQFFDLCEKIGVNYDIVMEAASADKRIGPSHLVVWHKGYRGFGGKCLSGEEIVYEVFENGIRVVPIKDFQGKRLLSFKDGKIITDDVYAKAERVVKQTLKFCFSKGRIIETSLDHLMIVLDKNGQLVEKEARDVLTSDTIPVSLGGLPLAVREVEINFFEQFSAKQDVFVEQVDRVWAEDLRPFLSFNQYKGLKRERNLSTPALAVIDAGFDMGSLRIKTSKTGSWAPSRIQIGSDFARLIGYYLAEGCCSDDRVHFSFGYHEKDLIEDVVSILQKFTIQHSQQVGLWKGKESNVTIKVSSRILSEYFKQFGADCYSKSVPDFIFISSQEIKDHFLSGLFRGDGAVVKSNTGDYYTISYATVSKNLIEGVDLLLREKGVMASRKSFMAKKSKVPCYQVLISESEAVRNILPLFSERRRANIKISGRAIKSPAYRKFGNMAELKIEKIEKQDKTKTVYSLETKSGFFLTSGGVLTHNCLPKDIRAIIEFADKQGVDLALLKTTEKINNDLMQQQGIADPEKFSKRE